MKAYQFIREGSLSNVSLLVSVREEMTHNRTNPIQNRCSEDCGILDLTRISSCRILLQLQEADFVDSRNIHGLYKARETRHQSTHALLISTSNTGVVS